MNLYQQLAQYNLFHCHVARSPVICVSEIPNSFAWGGPVRGACTATIPPDVVCPNLCTNVQRLWMYLSRSRRDNPNYVSLVAANKRQNEKRNNVEMSWLLKLLFCYFKSIRNQRLWNRIEWAAKLLLYIIFIAKSHTQYNCHLSHIGTT